jgi:hypothetical protein
MLGLNRIVHSARTANVVFPRRMDTGSPSSEYGPSFNAGLNHRFRVVTEKETTVRSFEIACLAPVGVLLVRIRPPLS